MRGHFAFLCTAGALSIALISDPAAAVDVTSTVTALRLADTITGGYMPSTDPLFTQMVTQVAAGNLIGAAQTAANSSYFANYMARRLAFQMQTPALDASVSTDNDSTTFIIAHLVGAAGIKPSISTLWSDNSTYLVDVSGGTAAPAHAAGLTAAQIAAVSWSQQLSQVAGQTAMSNAKTPAAIAIPAQSVGGFSTLSDRINDNSFAMYGATAGTNLRMIEGVWEIATGFQLIDAENTIGIGPQNAPRFVPEYDPNFFHGQGQAACLACHGGGMSSLNHGYATVADIFDFNAKSGFTYIAAPTTATMKSLGSDATKRTANSTCNLNTTPIPVCNPDSPGVGTAQAWDVSISWSPSGFLNAMGWTGPTSGQGLNSLGVALGQARVVYEFMTKRIINEICPMGAFTQAQVTSIGAAANPFANPAGSDDVRTIVAMVAADPSCQ